VGGVWEVGWGCGGLRVLGMGMGLGGWLGLEGFGFIGGLFVLYIYMMI